MSKSLLLLDTDHIKHYVFATDKLREIRAASALLDWLNRQTMPRAVSQVGGETVYANGGRGLFLVDSDRVPAIQAAVEQAFQEEAPTASFSRADIILSEAITLTDEKKIPTELRTLEYRLQAGKRRPPAPQALLTHPYLNFCSSCGVEYASRSGVEDNRTVVLCESCHCKREADKNIREKIPDVIAQVVEQGRRFEQTDDLWPYLIACLHEKGYPLSGYNRPNDFNELAALSSPAGYIGLIYADGDGMGRQVNEIGQLPRLKKFAEVVDESVYQATVEAICQHLQPAGGQSWPFDILMIGGDDLVMVTRAESALEVGLAVMQRFGELTEAGYDRPLRLSVGMAIAHAHYPFGQLLRLAESTLKFAKKQAAKHRQQEPDRAEGLLNFVVVSSANHLEFEKFYKKQLMGWAELADEKFGDQAKRLYRTLRPYTATDLAALIEKVRQLKALNTPTTKLEQLRALLFQTRKQAMVDSLSLLFHWRNSDQRSAIQEAVAHFNPGDKGLLFPWYQVGPVEAEARYYTPLLDLAEIYDFVAK